MNTTIPPSDTPEEPDFNGFGSFRRKRKDRGAEDAAPRRSFRRIPRDEFPEADGDAAAGFPADGPDAGEAAPRRPFRKPFGKKPFGKKPFGKKPFGKKKPFDHGEPHSNPAPSSFRDFADTIDEGDIPPPRRDRSFKNASGAPRGDDGDFHRPRKPFGGKPFGKKPFGKFRPRSGGRPFGDDADDAFPPGPRAIRRPYGAPADEDFPEDVPTPPRKPFGKKPFGKKPFGKKPFHSRKPFGAPPDDGAADDAPASFAEKPYARKPFGKKPFRKKPFGKKPFGKKPFSKKPFGKGKPFGKKPFGAKFRKGPPRA